MKYNKLHVVITLLGALMAAIVSYLSDDSVYVFCVKLLSCIAIFYVLGSIIKAYLRAKFGDEEAAEGEETAEKNADENVDNSTEEINDGGLFDDETDNDDDTMEADDE